MTNTQKRKGTDFERSLVKSLNQKVKGGSFRRVPGSGAFGTILNDPHLMGDITGRVRGINHVFFGEAKVGYGDSTKFSFQREWLEKIDKEASKRLGISFLACRFSNSRGSVQVFIVMSPKMFEKLVGGSDFVFIDLGEGGEKQFTVYRELLEKSHQSLFSGKFTSIGGTFYLMPLDVFSNILNTLTRNSCV
jgi:Holliday junction resolvase